jgi:hypothetical protein
MITQELMRATLEERQREATQIARTHRNRARAGEGGSPRDVLSRTRHESPLTWILARLQRPASA